MTNHSRHPRLPAERFFWALLTPELPADALRRTDAAMTRAVLDEAFAPHLPTDLARVGMAYAVLPSGAVLACALPVSALEEPALALAGRQGVRHPDRDRSGHQPREGHRVAVGAHLGHLGEVELRARDGIDEALVGAIVGQAVALAGGPQAQG